MRLATLAASVVLVALLALSASAGEAAPKKGKNKNKTKGAALAGSIVQVDEVKKGEGLGTITVKTRGKKGAAAKESKVEITKDTKITKRTAQKSAKGQKGPKSEQTAGFSDLKSGERVVVRAQNGVAQSVAIVAAKKKNKKNVAAK